MQRAESDNAIAPIAPQVNTTTAGADSLVTAVCMKNVQDWMSLGSSPSNGGENAIPACLIAPFFPPTRPCTHPPAPATIPKPTETKQKPTPTPVSGIGRDKYYCLPTFDVQGWPAGQGPSMEEFGVPAKAPITDFPMNTEPLICAGQCSTTPGCEYFVQIKPAGCYLKSRPFDSDSKFGSTGPNQNVDVSCFRGDEAWIRAGSVLDAALPQLPVSYTGGGLLTGAVAGVTTLAGNASALTYYCIREYGINGTVYSSSTVGAGGCWVWWLLWSDESGPVLPLESVAMVCLSM
jgi:hypothetical protein